MGTNKNLHKAKSEKNDEFYTRYDDIAKEIVNYPGAFKGQWVYCPCDHYSKSNFVKYFKEHFQELGLSHLTSTHINLDGTSSERYDYDGVTETIVPLLGNGDFRSEECTRIKNECDLVVTNPPFSLFREFVSWLNIKKFIVVGNVNSIITKELFPLVKSNSIWFGKNQIKSFITPNLSEKSFGNIVWYTNIEHNSRPKKLELLRKFDDLNYQRYDNYDAIEVSRVKDIPNDYFGVMGVPITFFQKFNPSQFEIVGQASGNSAINGFGISADYRKHPNDRGGAPILNGKLVFSRLLIKQLYNQYRMMYN